MFSLKNALLALTLGVSVQSLAENFTINVVSPDGGVTQQQFTEKTFLQAPRLLEHTVIKLLNTYDLSLLYKIYPLYQKLPEQDPIIKLWASAVFLSIESPDEAIIRYRQLLEKQPKLLPAQLQLAILLLRHQRADEAKPILRKLTQSSHQIYQSVARNYLDFLTPISKWDYDFSLSYIRDNNINNVAPKGTQHGSLTSTADPVAVQGVSYYFNVNRAFHFQPYFAGINVEASGKYYDKHEYDELDFYFRPSIGVDEDNLQYGIAPFYHASFYSGGENSTNAHLHPYYQGVGSSLFLHYYPWKFFKISPNLNYEKRFYHNSNANDQTLRYGLNFAFLQKQFSFNIGVNLRQRFTKYASNNYHQWQFKIGASNYFSSGLGINFTAYYTPRYYKKAVAENGWIDFYRIARRDKEIRFDLTFWHNKVQFLGVMPRLTFEYKKFRSTDVFQNHVKKQVYVNFTKTY